MRSIVALAILICTTMMAGCGGGVMPAASARAVMPAPPVSEAAPVISALSPASIPAGAVSTMLTITGTGFIPSSVANWNGKAIGTTFVSATELTAALPASALAAGAVVQVTVANPPSQGGQSTALPLNIVSPTPTIASISPSVLQAGSAAVLIVSGTGFESNSTVLWNGTPLPTTFVNGATLQVVLSVSETGQPGIGTVSVQNPGPGGSTTGPQSIPVSGQLGPVVQSVTFGSVPMAACTHLSATITGSNFSQNATVAANGVALQASWLGPNSIVATFPASFVGGAGPLHFTVTNPGPPSLASAPFAFTGAPQIALCLSPASLTLTPGVTSSFNVQAAVVNAALATVTGLSGLPSGVSSATAFPLPIPASSQGAVIELVSGQSLLPGGYTLQVNGQAGTAMATEALPLATKAMPSQFGFFLPVPAEVGVPIGGASHFQVQVNPPTGANYNVALALGGLPSGVTASVSPNPVLPGQTITITLQADANAPVAQNAPVTLTGTPPAPLSAQTATFYLDVTAPPGSLPGNRTDFVSTEGTPYAAVFDATHGLIFASNPDWNRIDIISAKTHAIVKRIPIPEPRGLDITQDSRSVWVATGSQQMYRLDTSALTASRFLLPIYSSPFYSGSWEGDQVLALADSTLLLHFAEQASAGSRFAAIWDPSTNLFTPLSIPQGGGSPAWGTVSRTGDGTRVYAAAPGYGGCSFVLYEAGTRQLKTSAQQNLPCSLSAVNQDGSRLVLSGGSTPSLYDGDFNLLGPLPAPYSQPNPPSSGGAAFSPDGGTLYVLITASSASGPLIESRDVNSLELLGTAPAMAGDPLQFSHKPFLAIPFAADRTGMLLEIGDYGIAFDDATFFQVYGNNPPGESLTGLDSSLQTTFSGPLSGGTALSLSGSFSLTPDAWFGNVRGQVQATSSSITATSPVGTVSGPVPVKLLFPDGHEIFCAQCFTYGTDPQYTLLSGAAPEGGVPGVVAGLGIEGGGSGTSVSVGANTVPVSAQNGRYVGEPFPTAYLGFTTPSGTPGWADVSLITPNGSATLPKAFFYAQSVTDYASPDTFTAVLYDEKRQQVYLSAGDHIDVFSTSANQFLTPLHPVAHGEVKQFTGLALTPDGSALLAADLLDGSLAVINPDNPSSSYAISVSTPYPFPGQPPCMIGPLYVAATTNYRAFVSLGGLPGSSCGPWGPTYAVDLTNRTATLPNAAQCSLSSTDKQPGTDVYVDASADGSTAVLSGSTGQVCLYNVVEQTYTPVDLYSGNGIAIAGDGNVIASAAGLADTAGRRIGRLAQPTALFGSQSSPIEYLAQPLQTQKLNAAGSLAYWPYPRYFEIYDVQHGLLRMRFSLAETVKNTVAPLAIDAEGRQVFLLTDRGLTVVDLGVAPLSIGHLSQTAAAPGAQITLRGSGFTSGLSASVGGQPAAIAVEDANTLTLTVPSAQTGPEDIALIGADGVLYTLENGIVVQ